MQAIVQVIINILKCVNYMTESKTMLKLILLLCCISLKGKLQTKLWKVC